MSNTQEPGRRINRRITLRHLMLLVAVATVLIHAGTQSFPLLAHQGNAFLAVLGVSLGAVAVMVVLLREELRLIGRHPALLVAVALMSIITPAIAWLASLPGMLFLGATTEPVRVGGLTISLSLTWAITLVLQLLCAAWLMMLVFQAVREERVELGAAARSAASVRALWPTFVAYAIGWGVPLVATAALIGLMRVSMHLVLGLLLVATIVWNLATAALLPVLVDPRRRGAGGPAEGRGGLLRLAFALSWRHKGRWWLALVAQMLLLGLFTYIQVTLSTTQVDPTTGVTSGNIEMHTKIAVHAHWAGGFRDNTDWLADTVIACRVPEVPLASALLALVLLALAVAIKLRIVGALDQEAPPPPP